MTVASSEDITPAENRYGGEFALNYWNGVSSVLDGVKKTGNTVYCWSFYTFENPLSLDGGGNVQPKVCNYEYDEATATLKLWPRENTFFSNGDAVDVEDVFASVDRCIHVVKSPKTYVLNNLAKDPEIITDTDGIRKAVYVFQEHASTNLQYLSAYQPWCPVMPKEIVEKYGYDNTIVDPADCIATGPYKVAEFEPGVRVVLEPNEYYVPDENGLTGLAGPTYHYFDRILVYGISEDATVAMMLASGELDWSAESHPGNEYADLLEPLGFVLKPDQTFHSRVICFNMMNASRPVAADPNLRKAIVAAFNAKQYALKLEADGCYVSLDTELLVADNFSTLRLGEADYYAGGSGDLTVAKSYLDKSGYNGETLQLMIAGSQPDADEIILFEAMKALGMKVEYYQVAAGSVADDYYANCGDYDYDITMVNPTASFYSANKLVANIKSRFWKSERKDELFAVLQRTEPASSEAQAAWNELLDLWIEDCAVFPVLRFFNTSFVHKDLAYNFINESNNRIHCYWAENAEEHKH